MDSHPDHTGMGVRKCGSCGQSNPGWRLVCDRCGAALPEARSPGGSPASEGSVPPELEASLLTLLQQGRKVDAIRAYREEMGVDLKGAKEAVEALQKRHGIAASAGGCASLCVFAVLMVLVALAGLVTCLAVAFHG